MGSGSEFAQKTGTRRALVTGGGGFIGGHLVRRLLEEGYAVASLDIKPEEEWHQVHNDAVNLPMTDAGTPASFKSVLRSVDEVYHLAENMGGIGFIERNLVDCASSVVTSVNLLNALEPGQLMFFSSSACVYAQRHQRCDNDYVVNLYEWMAHPADPEPGYGWAKLYVEQLLRYHREERGLDVRVARFHNSYGPHGTWTGGREKAPAAICRKVALARLSGEHSIEIWGGGNQLRSFMWIGDNVEGIRRIARTNHSDPVNLGSEELVSVDNLVDITIEIAFGRPTPFRRIYDLDAPKGVRGRNSENTLLRVITDGWEPTTPLRDGLEKTYKWIYDQVVRSINA